MKCYRYKLQVADSRPPKIHRWAQGEESIIADVCDTTNSVYSMQSSKDTLIQRTFSRDVKTGKDSHSAGTFSHTIHEPNIALSSSNVLCSVTPTSIMIFSLLHKLLSQGNLWNLLNFSLNHHESVASVHAWDKFSSLHGLYQQKVSRIRCSTRHNGSFQRQ